MILEKIVADKKIRLREDKTRISTADMKDRALSSDRRSVSFYEALSKEGLSIIGEFKKASPSMGIIHNPLELKDRIAQYSASVDAISCLTEQDHFHGSAGYLKEIRQITPLPILRKDFIIDEYQIYEAKVIGADAILLIVAILSDEELGQFYALAHALGLDCLVEVHDEEEMQRAITLKADIIGVNNRNLKDFTITLDTTKRLSAMLPKGTVFVSESGVTQTEDIEFLKTCKVDALLIGRAFMESQNPQQLAREWKEVFRDRD